MKNIITRTTALTLIELVVAAMLVTIVLSGLFSISSVLTNNTQDYAQRFLLNSQTQATLSHILNNASLAINDVSHGDPGILAPLPADPNSFCIHQDISTPVTNNNPNNTPGVYTDDRWLCYTFSPANYQIYYCAMAYVPGGASPWGAASCTAANRVFLGTAFSRTPTFNASGFSITIQNRLNNSAAIDQENNPQVTKSGSTAAVQIGS